MAIRIREDGRILCAAKHPAADGDLYLNDGIHYKLSVETGAIVTEPMEADSTNPGRGGHAVHGEWWWAHEVPADAVIENLRSAVNEEIIDALARAGYEHMLTTHPSYEGVPLWDRQSEECRDYHRGTTVEKFGAAMPALRAVLREDERLRRVGGRIEDRAALRGGFCREELAA